MRNRRSQPRSGFTFLEILIAMLIVGVLSSVVGMSLYGHYRKAKVQAAEMQIRTFRSALEIYRGNHGVLPTERQGLDALCKRPVLEPVPENYPEDPYLMSREVPLDPWGEEYVYLMPGRDGARFEVISYGADRQEGGTGDDADLSSLEL